ncbi:MAG: hypothetical protein K2N73_10135 [Lachnospiraceae bacterium]|nr:hypothetical protein [Lachnospiraceae bacterium]
MDKEKMIQIYEAMADITLNRINKIKEAGNVPCEDTLEAVRTTQSLYETLNYANQLVIPTASARDVSNNLENDCKYTDRPDVR